MHIYVWFISNNSVFTCRSICQCLPFLNLQTTILMTFGPWPYHMVIKSENQRILIHNFQITDTIQLFTLSHTPINNQTDIGRSCSSIMPVIIPGNCMRCLFALLFWPLLAYHYPISHVQFIPVCCSSDP